MPNFTAPACEEVPASILSDLWHREQRMKAARPGSDRVEEEEELDEGVLLPLLEPLLEEAWAGEA